MFKDSELNNDTEKVTYINLCKVYTEKNENQEQMITEKRNKRRPEGKGRKCFPISFFAKNSNHLSGKYAYNWNLPLPHCMTRDMDIKTRKG